MARGALTVLAVLSSVAGMSADCTSADCPAVKPRPASLLQLKAQRNQAELDLADQEVIGAHTPQKLLQTVQRLVEDKLQASTVSGNETPIDGEQLANATPTEEPTTYFAVVRNAVKTIMIPHILSGLAADQQILNTAHGDLLGCAHQLSAEEEEAGVGARHTEHSSCRQIQADMFVDKQEKCRVFQNYVDALGEVPGSPNRVKYPLLVQRWRAYFATAVPLVEEHHAEFKELDNACTTAIEVWAAQESSCDAMQAAYEAVVCETVEHRQGGIGECLEKNVDGYNATIQSVTKGEGERIADFVAAKRILCYIGAIEDDENFQQATHDCHGLVVNTRECRISFPGWPLMPKDLDASKMYPCGKVWLSYAYGGLPFHAPHAECAKCPNLPDLDGSGSTFVRWGSLSCPEPSELVYKGFGGGSNHGAAGNGANLICLTENPTDAPDQNAGNNNNAIIYGVQYNDQYVSGGDYVNKGDVGCSTCSYNGASYTLWGSTECQTGHIELYTGNVMSSHNSHKRSEWVCVDKQRELHSKTNNGDQASTLLYLAEYECGSLPCGPFDASNEVACAVCGIPEQNAAVYTRWGHDACTDGSNIVYSGVAAGTHYGHNGGGYNSLCLTKEPTVAPLHAGGGQNHASLYGIEYEGPYQGKSVHNKDAACAVCSYTGKTAYTAWGTDECGAGHVELYKGNVWGDHHGHKRGDWVCVDPERKEHWKNNNGDQNGQLWYMAEYECGALPCGPFQNTWEVACAVCGIPDDFGAVFTRWGHNECPESARAVYSGHSASGAHNVAGGGANNICLTSTPKTPVDQNNGNNNIANLYGTEYQGIYVGANHNSWDAACVVCAYEGSATYDIWGTTSCGDEHDVLYNGNVMAGHHGHQKINYVCVDPERRLSEGGHKGNQGGAYWYLAEYECGSIPCGPYDTNKEAACAVCGIPGFGSSSRCGSFVSEGSCPLGQCTWIRDSCQIACITHRTNTSCSSQQCGWDEEYDKCEEFCQDFPSQETCPVGRCLWSGDACSPLSSD